MLLVMLATTYLILALIIVLTADRIAGLIFRLPNETAPSFLRITPTRFFRKAK